MFDSRTSHEARPARVPRVLLALLIILGLTITSTLPASASQGAAASDRVLPQLAREAAESPGRTFRVIIHRASPGRQADAAARAAGGELVRDLPLNAFVAEVPAQAVRGLSNNPNVSWITYDAPMVKTAFPEVKSTLGTIYPRVVGAPGQWSSGWTGRGVGVAVIDTGINAALPDFNDWDGSSRVKVRQTFARVSPARLDSYGHGTHVAGIIAGNSLHRTPKPEADFLGIAPEASLIDVAVAADDGVTYISDVVLAIEWVIQSRTAYNIRVLNLSLISSVPESYRTSLLSAAVERAWFSGIFVVVAAGNSGPGSALFPPANDPFVLTVGASDMVGTAVRNDDLLAPWSSYGVSQDGVSKPDVVAPGRRIVAPIAYPDAALVFPDRFAEPGQRYAWLSGTSVAAPIVSGAAALIFQAKPGYTNDQVKWLLMRTGYSLGSSTLVAGQGAGLVSLSNAIGYTGALQFANQGLTHSDLLETPDGATTYTSANWSTANWSTANWSTANWSTANWSTANWTSAPDAPLE